MSFGQINAPAGNNPFGGNNAAAERGFGGFGSSSTGWANFKVRPEKPNQSKRDPLGELTNSLSRLFVSGSYSDLTITCGSDRYKVHRSIICPRSTFFEAACNSAFKEAETREIDLPDDDPLAVKMMVHYLYHLDYPPLATSTADQSLAWPKIQPFSGTKQLTSDAFSPLVDEQNWPQSFGGFNDGWPTAAPGKKKKKRSGKDTETTDPKRPSNLVLHAKMYTLGEKYDLNDLKTLAMEKFEYDVKDCWDQDDFLLAAQEVYTSTIEHDRSMREVVVRVISEHSSLLDKKEAQDVVKSLDLAFDLLMHLRKN